MNTVDKKFTVEGKKTEKRKEFFLKNLLVWEINKEFTV